MAGNTVYGSVEGGSRYHCDQSGDSATIQVGGANVYLSASSKDFLQLAKVCTEAAKRIALKSFNAELEKNTKELEEQFKVKEEF
jgi:hypothetical protein